METEILRTRQILGGVAWTRSRPDESATYSQVQLEMILSIALLEGDWSKVEWATLCLQRALTRTEKEIFFARGLASCNDGLARHASSVTGIELTRQNIDDIAVLAVKLHHDTSNVGDMFAQGRISDDGIRRLVDTCLEVGLPMTAQMFADACNRTLTAEELALAETRCEERIWRAGGNPPKPGTTVVASA